MKGCNWCTKSKPLTIVYYYKSSMTVDGFSAKCKKCCDNNKDPHWDNDGLLLKCKKCNCYKNPDMFNIGSKHAYRQDKDRRCKTCKAKERKESRCRSNNDIVKFNRILTERLCGARCRAKTKNIYFELTVEDLKKLWEEQDGRCALSDIAMTYTMGEGRTPTNLSIDQIDPGKGYTRENTQLVCMAVNQMKSDLPMNELLMFCKGIVSNCEECQKLGRLRIL